MSSTSTTRRRRARRPRPDAGRSALLHAARLGAAAAHADLAGNTADGNTTKRAWKRLRRQVTAGQAREALRMAYTVGYGQTMQAAMSTHAPCDAAELGSAAPTRAKRSATAISLARQDAATAA